MTLIDTPAMVPVLKTVTVNATPARAFEIFTVGIDSWWMRTHHLGKTPMLRVVLTPRAGGRIYSEHDGGDTVDWGSIVTWEPTRRFTLAWQITPEWRYQPLLDKSSEVEVTFTEVGPGLTRVDLEHRHFERHGSGANTMRTAVDSEGGWTALLRNFVERVQSEAGRS